LHPRPHSSPPHTSPLSPISALIPRPPSPPLFPYTTLFRSCTAVGEEAQVDYGSGPMVRDPQSGKYRRTRLFVLTLGNSRKSVRLLVWRSSTRIWAELHEIGRAHV